MDGKSSSGGEASSRDCDKLRVRRTILGPSGIYRIQIFKGIAELPDRPVACCTKTIAIDRIKHTK
jgi:hypothetical protein